MKSLPNPSDTSLGDWLLAVLGGQRLPGAGPEFLKQIKMRNGSTLADNITEEDFEHVRILPDVPITVQGLYQHVFDYYSQSGHDVAPPQWGNGGFGFTATVADRCVHVTGHMQESILANVSALVVKN